MAHHKADDLPLNVSRETLQSNRFLRQLKDIILKRLIQLLKKIEEENPEKFEKVQAIYGSILKLGAVEDTKNRDKLTELTRFATTQRNLTSLDQYLENKKKGQRQVCILFTQCSVRFSSHMHHPRSFTLRRSERRLISSRKAFSLRN